jgi:3-hydroxyacyl-[acyl-carrier-protein] dehydratase
VDRQLEGGTMGSSTVDQSPASLAALLERLPHRAPFRFLSQLTAIDPGRSGSAVWEVNGSESFFAGHFPGRPIVPGVLLTEAMAQLSGIVTASQGTPPGSTGSAEARLVKVEVKFLQPVVPPQKIVLSSRARSMADSLACYDVQAVVRERPVAEGEIYLSWG